MLCLRRKPSESIIVNTPAGPIRIVNLSGQPVKIGVEAPPEMNIVRAELVDQQKTKVA
jgi:carbon storage regulator CsrA